jgi:dTDP-4-amino-4,6-dideoxygalactose transaminase
MASENRKVRMRNLSILDSHSIKQFSDKFLQMITNGELIQGEEVEHFESELNFIVDSPFSVSCSSASSGLYLALKSLNLSPGDEVITTPLTWLVTASSILQVGATPVFVDVDEDYNLDPESIIRAINEKTKAILVVHYYGKLAQIEAIADIARKHDLVLIEDAAQAFGVKRNNIWAGTFGDLGVFSFSPMKVIGGLGDAGAIVTRSKSLYDRLLILRHCGTINKEYCISPESKHIMDAIHAGFLRLKLKSTEDIITRRRQMALRYIHNIGHLVKCPNMGNDFEHSAYDFPIQLRQRDELCEYLHRRNIEARIRHPLLVSDQEVHRNSVKMDLTNASKLVRETLCLPIHNNIEEWEVDYVCEAIKEFFEAYPY